MDMKVFADSLSPEEIETLYDILHYKRKRMILPTLPELDVNEKALADTLRPIDAIKAYRARLGMSLYESKLAVGRYLGRIV